MFETLHPILEWLSEEHGRRGMYGLEMIILAAFNFFGVFAANELRAKKKSLKNRMVNFLSKAPLVANACSDTVGFTQANLEKTSDGYRLTIINHASKSKNKNDFKSLEEVESFLDESTFFKLSDFMKDSGKS